MININLDSYDLSDLVIHCPTMLEAEQLMEYLDKRGFVWDTAEPHSLLIDDNCWYWYAEETCYSFDTAQSLYYSSKEHYEVHNHTIIRLEDLLINTISPKEFYGALQIGGEDIND